MDGLGVNYFNRVKYEFFNEIFGTLEMNDDPKGWDSDNKEIARNDDYFGITSKFSNNLEFFGDAAEFIRNVKYVEDIRGQIRLTKYERNPQTDVWERIYWGYLDLSTFIGTKSSVKVKFNSGGLEQAIKNRESEDFEIDRLTTVNGFPLDPLRTIDVALDGRRIFLKSLWKQSTTDNYVNVTVTSDAGNERSQSAGFPMNLDSRSHEEAQTVLPISNGSVNDGTTGMMLLANVQRDKLIKIKGKNIKFKPRLVGNPLEWQVNFNWTRVRVSITTYKNGLNYEVKHRNTLWMVYGDNDESMNEFYNTNDVMQALNDFELDIELNQGESIALEVLLQSDLNFGNNRRTSYMIYDVEGEIAIEEDSVFEPSKSKAVLYHEYLERLVSICTDKTNAFRSNFFGRTNIGYPSNGKGALTGVLHGFWVRGFEKDTTNTDDRFKPITTSLRDAIDNAIVLHNVSMGIESVNNIEKVVVEDIRYFFRDDITIRLPLQAKNVERTPYTKMYFDAVEFGSSKGGDYEEANGLDEPNTRSRFTTVYGTTKNTYSKVSSYRFDSYGLEFARRKPKLSFPTTDTNYDTDVFCLDLKQSTLPNVYQTRKYADDFSEIPTGVFAPETAFNLRYSPLNIALRHSNVFSGCLKKYPAEKLRYSSSENNNNLYTKLRTDSGYQNDPFATVGNGFGYAENSDVPNNELKRGFIYPEQIKFEHKCDFDVLKLLDGFTVINGKRVPNFYGKVEFTNEFGQLEYGWILSVKPNGKGEFIILKSNQ
jgi:hypothetical protein